jgi:hypothetical protein
MTVYTADEFFRGMAPEDKNIILQRFKRSMETPGHVESIMTFLQQLPPPDNTLRKAYFYEFRGGEDSLFLKVEMDHWLGESDRITGVKTRCVTITVFDNESESFIEESKAAVTGLETSRSN